MSRRRTNVVELEEDRASRELYNDPESANTNYSDGMKDSHSDPGTKTHNNVDYSSAALYVPGVQVIIALILCCSTTIAVASLSNDCRSSVPRAATLSVLVGMACVFRPLRVHDCHGMDLIFDTIRPAVVAYCLAIITGQLIYIGKPETELSATMLHTSFKRILYHALMLVAAAAGFVRAYRPTSQQDMPFLVALIALVVIALFPPEPVNEVSPLCHLDGVWDAFERLSRATLFGIVFCALAYASEPSRYSVGEIALCAARATAASAWILGVHRFALVFALAQAALAITRRLSGTDAAYDEYQMPYSKTYLNEQPYANAYQNYPLGLAEDEGFVTNDNSDGAESIEIDGFVGGSDGEDMSMQTQWSTIGRSAGRTLLHSNTITKPMFHVASPSNGLSNGLCPVGSPNTASASSVSSNSAVSNTSSFSLTMTDLPPVRAVSKPNNNMPSIERLNEIAASVEDDLENDRK